MTSSRFDGTKELELRVTAQPQQGEIGCHNCTQDEHETADLDSWIPIVRLLEELELSPLETTKFSKAKAISGLVAFALSLALFVFSVVVIINNGSPTYLPVMLVGAVVLFVVGIVLCLVGSSTSQFRWINVKIQTVSNSFLKISQTVLALYLWASCGILAFFVVYPDPLNSRSLYIAASLALSLAVGCLCAMFWNKPIALRIIELRSGLGIQGPSAVFEVSVLAAFSTVAVAGLTKLSLSWESVACALLLGLVGYWAYRWRKIEAANSEVIDALDRVRSAARRVNREDSQLCRAEGYNELLDSYRELQIYLLSGTRHVRQRVVSFGLLTLCAIADARRDVGVVASEFVYGGGRISASQEILDMTDERFAHGSAQVFDGIQRMMSDGFYPQMSKKSLKEARKGSTNSDLNHYLRYWALRF